MWTVSRFWRSLGTVALYLLAIGLLEYILWSLSGIIGIFVPPIFPILTLIIAVVVPVIATRTYIDWRWNWKPGHIGLGWRPAALGWVGAGLVGGVLAAALAHVINALMTGAPLTVPTVNWALSTFGLISALLPAMAIEVVWRGAVISRLQSDLDRREAMLMAVAAPFIWMFLCALFRRATLPDTGIDLQQPFTMFMSAALSLLVLRTDSVWLSAGLRAGMGMGAVLLNAAGNGGIIIWAVVAGILLALEWFRQQRSPRKVQPKRGQWGGRVHRGPWGPH